MKKIFSIIAAVLIVIIGVFLGVLNGVKKDIGIAFSDPVQVYIYNKSTTALNNQSYRSENKPTEYKKIVEELRKITKISLFQLAQNNNNLNYKAEYDSKNYANYNDTMKTENIVVEFIYTETQNVIVYDEGNPRVIPFTCLLFIIPTNQKLSEIVVYHARNNGGNQKEDQYREAVPIILKGISKKFNKYVTELAKANTQNSTN